MSWRDPNWKYEPAATHGDPALFAQRQRERAEAAANAPTDEYMWKMREDWRPMRVPGVVYAWDVTEAPQ